MMYSAEYVMTLTNLVKLFTSVKYSIIFLMFDIFSRNLHLLFSTNVGVRNSVGFFTCDVFCPVCHNLYEFDRFSTSVQYIIEFLTFDIIGQTSYTWPYRRI